MKGKTVAVIRYPAALEEDCRIADIVIAPFSVGKGCETAVRVVIDRRTLKAEGATRDLHRGAVDQERKRRRDARTKARGA